MTVPNAVVSGLQSNLIVLLTALSAMLLFLCGEIGANLFLNKESEEFARLTRRYPLAGRCLEAEAPNLRHAWNFLVHYRRLTNTEASNKSLRKVSSKRRKANRRALVNSKRAVESFFRGYAASYGSTGALEQLNTLNTRWQTWRGVITAMGLSVVGLCLIVPIMTRKPEWAHDPIVTNLPLIALFLEICFFLFVFISFEATYKSSCLALFSLVPILYNEKTSAKHKPSTKETELNVKWRCPFITGPSGGRDKALLRYGRSNK